MKSKEFPRKNQNILFCINYLHSHSNPRAAWSFREKIDRMIGDRLILTWIPSNAVVDGSQPQPPWRHPRARGPQEGAWPRACRARAPPALSESAVPTPRRNLLHRDLHLPYSYHIGLELQKSTQICVLQLLNKFASNYSKYLPVWIHVQYSGRLQCNGKKTQTNQRKFNYASNGG